LRHFRGEAALSRLSEFLGPQRRIFFDAKNDAVASASLKTAEIGRMRVTRFSIDFNLEFTNEAQADCVHFQFIDSGVIEYGPKGRELLGSGKGGDLLTAHIRGGDRHLVRTNADRVGLSIHQDGIREIAQRHFGIMPPRTISFHGIVPAASAGLAELRNVVCAILETDDDEADTVSEARKAYETAVLVSLLHSVPSSISESLRRAEASVSPAYVIRAQEFIRANLGETIAIEDIADAARCTARNLQLTFRRDVGMSPMRYLRKLRLEDAQRRLLSKSDESLTSIAMSLGFTNLGRFAKDYKTAFGELPSQFRRNAEASVTQEPSASEPWPAAKKPR
jgi:AraC-like DNA-binding protein